MVSWGLPDAFVTLPRHAPSSSGLDQGAAAGVRPDVNPTPLSLAGLTAHIGHAGRLDDTVGGGSAARRRPLVASALTAVPAEDPLRVLIADDNPLFPELLLRFFHHHEWIQVVGCAANGRDAVTLASATTPDVVLMDLNMPLLDGVEATRRIVARDADVVVVVLTASATPSECHEVLAAGARMVLPKSIDLAVVVGHLREAYLDGSDQPRPQTQTESSPARQGARSNQP